MAEEPANSAAQLQLDYENYYLGQPSNLSKAFAEQLFMPVVWPAASKLPTLLSRHTDFRFGLCVEPEVHYVRHRRV